MNRSQKRRLGVFLFMGLSAAAILYSLDRILDQEAFQWIMGQSEYKTMMAETAELFAAFCLSGFLLPKNWQKLAAAILITSVFLWAHMAFTPVAVTGLYTAYILFFGRFLRVRLFKLPQKDGPASDFLTGSAFLLGAFCLMSAVGIGAIEYLTVFVFASAGILILLKEVSYADPGKRPGIFFKDSRTITSKTITSKTIASKTIASKAINPKIISPSSLSAKEIFLLAFLLTMLCLQAGRLNIAMDYDSLWYGVRSRYILDNGHGIYENMGTIGIVYTYSKGFEVLTLPLCQLPSYSFVTAINLWLAGGVLYLGYKIGLFFMKREQAFFLAALLSGVPGIMNMAVTAKSDMMTLLIQEIMVYYLLCYIKAGRQSWRYLAYALSAYLVTLTLKPTALVFSTAVFGMAFLFFLWKGFFPQLGREKQNKEALAVIAVSMLALAGIWARTVVITGLPFTSVFSSLLTKAGFHMKYPFEAGLIPNITAGKGFGEKLWQLASRLYGIFFCPVGPDMDHVILAWGGYMLFFLLLLWITSCFCGKNVDRGEKKDLSLFLKTIYIPFLAVNFISLVMLTQVDGNYFMLLYVLTAVSVLKAAAQAGEKTLWRGAMTAGAWVLLFSVFFTSMTNWSWSLGFTPVSFRHKGFYNHQEAAREDMASKGNEKIWNLLAQNPETRLIAVGDHPAVLAFPCSAQSYDDITGVWGNVTLVKKMDYFVQFMDYAKTDYVYLQAGYAGEESRSYTLVRDLIEWGKLVPVLYEDGNLLAAVEVRGERSESSVRALTEFEQCYIKKETNEKQQHEEQTIWKKHYL